MIKDQENMAVDKIENMRGGNGIITIKHCFNKDEIKAKCRLCSKIIIPPNAGIGFHEHKQEVEFYFITKGEGFTDEGDGVSRNVKAGDAIMTGDGQSHSIKNIGNEDLEMIAVIITE